MKSGSAESQERLPPKVCPACGQRFGADALFCANDGTPLANAGSAQKQGGPAVDGYLGRTILDHIELRQLAGVGAMGRVYRAFQKGVDRDVAVKILHRELSANEQLVARFHREAKVASRLQHPNVVHVHLAGQLPDGSMYIAMEFLDGMSLQSALAATDGAMDLPRTLHIALQICDAAGEAHAQGIVHRDLKPENVMLVRRGADADFVKVLDFGIARLNWGEQSMATAAGLIFGTARYISPEGAQGETVGPAGDVYGIATLVFQMLAGRTPFEGEQAVALLVQQIHDAPPHLKSIERAAYVPDPIAHVVMRNLAKDPMARDADARAFGRSLVDAAKAAGLSADELVARPMLLGSRPSGSVQLAPMSRTKQMELTPEVTAKLAAAAPETKRTPPPTPGEKPALPTTTQPLPRAAVPTPPRPSGVDITLDDAEAPPLPPPERSGAMRTQMSAPLPVALPTPTPAPAVTAPGARARPSAPSHPSVPDEEESLEEPEPEAIAARRSRSRAVFIFVACFLVGVIGSAAIAFKLGLVGQQADEATLDRTVERANAALQKQHWDAPPGDNVLEITTEGLKKWPNEQKLLDVRAHATDELVKDAVGEKYQGHKDQATKLAKLAHELDPSDVTAAMLLDELQGTAVDAGAAPSLDAGLSQVKPPPVLPTAPRATLDASPQKPRVGQPIEVTIRIATATGAPPKQAPTEAELTVIGPGLGPNTRFSAAGDAQGVLHVPITLYDPGKFDLVFSAKVDGTAVKAQKSIIVVSTATPTDTGTTNAVDAGKWL